MSRNPSYTITRGPGLQKHDSIRGFVLAEILVVSVIVAILAAVAIPVYTGYVAKQRRDMVKNLAATGAVSANMWFRRNGVAPTPGQLGLFLTEPARYNVLVEGGWVKVIDVSVTPNIRDSAAYN